MLPATTVLFAIQAAVRLYSAGKGAYAQHVATSDLAFPLVKGLSLDEESVSGWLQTFETQSPERFEELYQGGSDGKGYKRLMAALYKAGARSDDDKLIITDAYIAIFPLVEADALKAPEDAGKYLNTLNNREQIALYRVQQWTAVEIAGAPSPFWTVAGALVEIAVDYFANQPGAVSTKTPKGRALRAFLQAVDENVDFENPHASSIISNLMIAALDTVSEHPKLIAGGNAEEKLVKSVSAAMAQSITARKQAIKGASSFKIDEIGDILQTVARAAIRAGADTVLSDPKTFLDIGTAESDLVTKVGTSLVDIVFEDDGGIDLGAVWSVESLEKLADAAFRAVAEHPELVSGSGDEPLKKLVKGLAADLAAHEKVISRDALPDIFSLVVEHTTSNLDALWGRGYADGAEHLLVTASRQLLAGLKASTSDGKWPPKLTRDDLVETLDAIFAEVVDNKAWIDITDPDKSLLKSTVDDVFGVLKKYKLSQIHGDTGLAILRAVLQATGQNLVLSRYMPGETRAFGVSLVDALLASLFKDQDAGAHWLLTRQTALATLVEVTFDQAEEALPIGLGSAPDAEAQLKAKLDAARAVFDNLAMGKIEPDAFEDAILAALQT